MLIGLDVGFLDHETISTKPMIVQANHDRTGAPLDVDVPPALSSF
jgi:hypothetical protein